MNGGGFFKNVDDIDRRVSQSGLLGFSPRDWEAAQAFQLYQRGWSKQKIKEAVAGIGRYGLGRTAAEKSANFVFFPFSFSKKLLSTLGDFLIQAPARALLLHEGMRRYHESSLDEDFHTLIEKHAPLLEQLSSINNLSFGLSPGRFFLEGITDRRTDAGKVMQALSAVFVPSGAATSLSQAAGALGDMAVNAFVPVVLTGESIDRAGGVESVFDVIRRYVPLVREVDQYFLDPENGIRAQWVALSPGGAPYYQLQTYVDGSKEAKAELEPIALSLGYSSVDGLLSSDIGIAFEPHLRQQIQALQEANPTGFQMAQRWENDDALNSRALLDLANQADKSAAEERLLEVFEHIESWKFIADIIGLDSQLSHVILGKTVRDFAKRSASDRRFVELWDRFLAREFGPLRRVA